MATVTLPTSGFEKENCILGGWTIDNAQYNLGSSYDLTKDTTAYAEWFTNEYVTLPTEEQVWYDGYILIGWQIDGVTYAPGSVYHVTKNVEAKALWQIDKTSTKFRITNPKTVILHGKIKIYRQDQFPATYKYSNSDEGLHTVWMSRNISSLGVNDDVENGTEHQLLSIYLHDNIIDIQESCFANCYNLSAINATNKLTSVGSYAFYNCQNLSNIYFLDNDEATLYHVGDYAFAKSGLKRCAMRMKRSVSDTGSGAYCFASCYNLKSFTFREFPDIGSHMFDSCTSLTSVFFPSQYHAYMGECGFKNCENLQLINIPSAFQGIMDNTFEGCTLLQKVNIPANTNLCVLGSHVFKDCPSLTSITLPSSITSFSQIDPEFLADSSIEEVTFLGIDDDVFTTTTEQTLELEYELDKWYSKAEDINGVFKCANEKHIPVVCATGLATCSRCEAVFDYSVENVSIADYPYDKSTIGNALNGSETKIMKCNPDTIDFSSSRNGRFNCQALASTMNDAKYFRVFGCEDRMYLSKSDATTLNSMYSLTGKNKYKQNGIVTIYNSLTTLFNNVGNSTWGTPSFYLYWKKSDGTIVKKSYPGSYHTAKQYIDQINEAFSGYDKSIVETKQVTTFNTSITTLGKSGTVRYISKSGNSYDCTNNSVEKVYETIVDKYTTSNFKYGIWYYNAIELKEFADAYHIPVFAERSSEGCAPCKLFRNQIWKDSDFQAQIKTRKCLLCRIEIAEDEKWDTDKSSEAYYISHTWGKANTLIPELIFYWNKSDGTVYEEHLSYAKDKMSYETLLNKIDAMCSGYVPSDSFVMPNISSDAIGSNQIRYYANETDDDIGKYFICESKTKTDIVSIDIDLSKFSTNNSTVSLTSLSYGQTLNIQPYTYQIFIPNDDSTITNERGIIFKYGQKIFGSNTTATAGIEYIYEFDNSSSSNGSSQSSTIENEYKTNTLYQFTDENAADDFDTIINIAISDLSNGSVKEHPIVIFMHNSSDTSFDTLFNSAKFKSFINTATMSENDFDLQEQFMFLDMSASDWTKGAAKAVKDFEDYVNFVNINGSSMPKILIYMGCKACGGGDFGSYYNRHCIAYDSSEDVDYYISLIQRYGSMVIDDGESTDDEEDE